MPVIDYDPYYLRFDPLMALHHLNNSKLKHIFKDEATLLLTDREPKSYKANTKSPLSIENQSNSLILNCSIISKAENREILLVPELPINKCIQFEVIRQGTYSIYYSMAWTQVSRKITLETTHMPEREHSALENWRKEYNHIRPHSSLGYKPPAPEAIQREIHADVNAGANLFEYLREIEERRVKHVES